MAQLKIRWALSVSSIPQPHSSHRSSVDPGGKASPFLDLFETKMPCSGDHVCEPKAIQGRLVSPERAGMEGSKTEGGEARAAVHVQRGS